MALKKQHLPFVLISLLLLIHTVLMLSGSWERSADGWIHLFFSEHWYLRWFDHWEPRWNLGFSMFSYPPLAHQCVALLRFFYSPVIAGLLMMCLTLLLLISGFYRYGRLWFSKSACLWGILLIFCSSPLAIAVHTFGQYPNLFAWGFLMHGLATSSLWFKEKRFLMLTLSLCLCAVFSSLYASVFGLLLMGLPVLLQHRHTPHFGKNLMTLSLYGLISSSIALAPFLYFRFHFAATDTMSVYHSSKGNVLAWKPFNWFMFYGQYASLFLVWPLLIFQIKEKSFKAFFQDQGGSLGLMILLSTGGSTAIVPRILGPLFDHLTLDRFGQWASFLLLLALGYACQQLWRKQQYRKYVVAGLIIHLSMFIYSAGTTWIKPLPRMIPLQHVQIFLDQHQNYRYLTLGLHRANQAKLSTLTQAFNVDGNFPFGRNFEPLNHSGMASLDMAKHYGRTGLTTLQKILKNAETNHLRYIIVRDTYYTELLIDYGYLPIKSHGVLTIWENKRIPAIKGIKRPENFFLITFLSYIWALAPLSILFIVIVQSVTILYSSRKCFNYR